MEVLSWSILHEVFVTGDFLDMSIIVFHQDCTVKVPGVPDEFCLLNIRAS